ncbi:MAG: glycosyltransferase [Gammaproteobacteria bacterium]|nr:glycosyltransferase [Gammaproteobacteria bacterium]
MKLSVIIPTFNRSALLRRALESVTTQRMPDKLEDIQLIVVDDGSEDDTGVMVNNEFPEVVYLTQENRGVSAARNTGINAAEGDWIAFLDSDDEWLPDKLVRQFQKLEESQLLVCHTQEIWIRNGVRVNQMRKHKKTGGWIFQDCLPLCAMSPSSILIHRTVFEQTGLFDESLAVCEDYDLWLRITAQYEVDYVVEPCLKKYGGHQDQLSRRHWGMDRFRVLALDKILSQGLEPKMHRAALEMLNSKLNILLNGAIKHGNDELVRQCEEKLIRWAT